MISCRHRRATRAALPLICLLALTGLSACGGGGGSTTLKISVSTVTPNQSLDLTGGETVTLTGKNFQTGQVYSVTFAATPGTNLLVQNETTLTVKTPPAPGGNPGVVSIEVFSIEGGNYLFFDAYTYVGGPVTPAPTSITPTSFTASGAQDFTIGGTNLGTPGGMVDVIFQGIGTVTGTVSFDAQFVVGRAPVSLGAPPTTPLTVTIDTGSATADVPTQVNYTWASTGAPYPSQPGQAAGGASRPQRLASGWAVMCTAGPNQAWGDFDDDILLIQGPTPPVITPVRRPGNMAVGYLDPVNSVPAVLDGNNFAVVSTGLDGALGTADDRLTLISRAQTVPTVTDFPFSGNFNAAPLARISSSSVAFTDAGLDTALGTADDRLTVVPFNLAAVPPVTTLVQRLANLGPVDVTPGPGNLSIPFSGDGDVVCVVTAGVDTTPGTGDDQLWSLTASTGLGSTPAPAGLLMGRPLGLSGTLAAAPAAGPNTTFGDIDDALAVFTRSGTTWTRADKPLNGPLSTTMVVPYVRAGTGGIALALTGAPDVLRIYTDPAGDVSSSAAFTAPPLLSRLGSGDLAVFGPGADRMVRTTDDSAVFVKADATLLQSFSSVPTGFQAVAPETDQDRAFLLSPGGDGAFGTNDDLLEVFQARALDATASVTRIPAGVLSAPLTGTVPFVPVGADWGLAQSPGPDLAWGTGDDQLLLVRF